MESHFPSKQVGLQISQGSGSSPVCLGAVECLTANHDNCARVWQVHATLLGQGSDETVNQDQAELGCAPVGGVLMPDELCVIKSQSRSLDVHILHKDWLAAADVTRAHPASGQEI